MRLGVVGAGPAGIISAIVASRALKRLGVRAEIDVFEERAPFRGRAFDTNSTSMLLNTSIDLVSANPDNADEFLEYLGLRHHEISREDHVSRVLARGYVQAEFEKEALSNDRLLVVDGKVKNIELDGRGRFIVDDGEDMNVYEALILASGRRFKDPPDAFAAMRVVSPYPERELSAIERDRSVLIAGTGLSAVDVLAHLSAQGHTGAIHMYSPSGLLPSVRRSLLKQPRQPLMEDFLRFDKRLPAAWPRTVVLLVLFERRIEEMGMSLRDFMPQSDAFGRAQLEYEIHLCRSGRNVWEPLTMELVDGFNHIWPCISETEKHAFQRRAGPWINRLIVAMPLHNALIVQKLFARGQLTVSSGHAPDWRNIGHDWIAVNATGLARASQNPLLIRMSMNGLLRLNDGGGVVIDADTYRTRPDLPVYANGSVLQDSLYTANSIYSTTRGAHRIAADLCGR